MGAGGADTGSAWVRSLRAAAHQALGAPSRWHRTSVWRSAVGGEDKPTTVPTAVPTRGGGNQELPPRHVPGARPGAPQTGLQVILARGPELVSLSPPYRC